MYTHMCIYICIYIYIYIRNLSGTWATPPTDPTTAICTAILSSSTEVCSVAVLVVLRKPQGPRCLGPEKGSERCRLMSPKDVMGWHNDLYMMKYLALGFLYSNGCYYCDNIVRSHVFHVTSSNPDVAIAKQKSPGCYFTPCFLVCLQPCSAPCGMYFPTYETLAFSTEAWSRSRKSFESSLGRLKYWILVGEGGQTTVVAWVNLSD